jgi:para-nitrobenzyl esterase
MKTNKDAVFVAHAPRKSIVRTVLLGSWLAAAALSTGALALGDEEKDRQDGPVVSTAEGPVKGITVTAASTGRQVFEFLGIPYAEPPVGELRWRPPVDHKHWTTVLRATQFAPICAQSNEFGLFAGPPNDNEDCLYLNVFTPTLDRSAHLPVIFWIHGGGNIDGETPGYDGSKLASDGKTVVVTVAYRLNLIGWLAHPALDAEGHPFGNYGLLDQQLALRWVKENIARFGGDKDNVTAGGQSAGALDAALNMVSPLAAGLLDRVICQSFCPAPLLPGGNPSSLATAEARGVAFAVAAGCGAGTDPDTARCLRNLTSAQIQTISGTGNFYSPQGIVDGRIVPDQPVTLYTTGKFAHVPLINGDVEDEENFFLAITEYDSNTNNALRTPPTETQYIDYVNTTFGSSAYPAGTAAMVLALYPASDYATAQLAWDRVGTDSSICGQRFLDKILASQIPVYAYEFDDRTAPFYFPQMPGFQSLAYHTSDIQYLFPLWHGGPDGIQHSLNPEQTVLSDQLVRAWSNFARAGNPNGAGNSPWPRYTTGADEPAWLIEDISKLSTLTDAQYSALRHCDFWESLIATPN